MSEHRLLFIYGTLKKDCHNAELMRRAEYLGEAITNEATWTLKAITTYDFPYPVLTAGTHRIKGELYRVDHALLHELDVFELALPFSDQEYERRLITLSNGENADTYTALPHLAKTSKKMHPFIQMQNNIQIWNEL